MLSTYQAKIERTAIAGGEGLFGYCLSVFLSAIIEPVLACNATSIVLDTTPTCDAQANQKGGLWWAEEGFCDNPVLNTEPVCYPSEMGVVLS